MPRKYSTPCTQCGTKHENSKKCNACAFQMKQIVVFQRRQNGLLEQENQEVQTINAQLNQQNHQYKNEICALQNELSNLQRQTTRFQNTYGRLLQQNNLSDVMFKIENTFVPAHRFVLSAASPVFLAMFKGHMKESLDGVVSQEGTLLAFHHFLQYVYTCKTEITGDTVIELMYLAKKYGVQELTYDCCVFLEGNMTVENVCTLLMEADYLGEMQIKGKCEDFIVSNLELVTKVDGFYELESSFITQLVERDDFNLPEIDIFNLCHDWAKRKLRSEASQKNIKEILKDTLLVIRFTLIPPQELVNTVYASELLDDDTFLRILLFVISAGVHQTTLHFRTNPRQPFQMKQS